MAPVGVSNGGAPPPPSWRADTPPASSPLPVDYRASLAKKNERRFVAQGHAGGRFEADVYVTPAAKDVAFASSGAIGRGTVLVMPEVARGRPGAEEPEVGGPILMMEKEAPGFDATHGDWRYVVVDGARVEDGPLRLCASCHDAAPHDHVFAVE